jgi:hypothetical protein
MLSEPVIFNSYHNGSIKQEKNEELRRNLKRSVQKGRKIKHQSRLDPSKQDFP